MKIAVLGATGRTGRQLLPELLRRGHDVTALVRDPAKLDPEIANQVEMVVGDGRDPAKLSELVAGADAVVSGLGPTAKDRSVHTDIITPLISAMESAGVRRFVGVSGAGLDVPGDAKSGRDRAISWLMQRVGGSAVADKAAEHRALADSSLEWTLVRAPRLGDGAATGAIEHDAHRSPRSTVLRRSDLAVFLADLAENGGYSRQAPLVAEVRSR